MKKEIREVVLGKRTIIEVQAMSINGLEDYVRSLDKFLGQEDQIIAAPIISDLLSRIEKYQKVKVAYLSLLRSMPTLSGGEAQRIKIASLLSSGLSGVLYILDEPCKGLHGKDIQNLLEILKELRDQGNHILLIEHNLKVIRAADFIIDMGPQSGTAGGEVIAAGTSKHLMKHPRSITGQVLNIPFQYNNNSDYKKDKQLIVEGMKLHNINNLDLSLPLENFIGIAGVSGSGKSTVMMDIIAKDLIEDDLSAYLYIFDEPSTGLHYSDNKKLLNLFKKIKEKGNTVVVIEQNPQSLFACDYIIEMGPESGFNGGDIIFSGSIEDLLKKETPTSQYLKSLL